MIVRTGVICSARSVVHQSTTIVPEPTPPVRATRMLAGLVKMKTYSIIARVMGETARDARAAVKAVELSSCVAEGHGAAKENSVRKQ